MTAPTKKYGPSIRDTGSTFERESRRLSESFNGPSRPFMDGILLSNISLTTATTHVPHQLSRPYRGFIVMDQTAQGNVWRDTSYTDRPQDVIPLKASTTLTLSIWVF